MLQRKIKAVSFTILISLAITISAMSKTIKVPGDYPLIQQAIDASVDGDTVLVDPGTYTENIDFKGKAITVTSSAGAEATIIDGSQTDGVVLFQTEEGLDSVIEGFTLTNGNRGGGGGVCCHKASPTIRMNKIIHNTAGRGGGIYCSHGDNPLIENNRILDNYAEEEGGGIAAYYGMPTVIHNEICDNYAKVWGGGIICGHYCGLILTNNLVSNNSSEGGGGIFVEECMEGTAFSYNVIQHNTADSGGGIGGVYWSGKDDLLLHGNIVRWNTAQGIGGGAVIRSLKLVILTDNIIYENSAGTGGGGLHIEFSPQITCSGNTLAYNSASGSGGAIRYQGTKGYEFDLNNSILWDNTSPQGPEIHLYGSKSTLDIAYSDVKGGQSSVSVDTGSVLNWGPGMIDSDPLFVDRAEGDFHLTYQSPCRDSGDNGAAGLPLEDFEGDPRIALGTVDMGADEFHRHLYYTGEATPGLAVNVNVVGTPFKETLLCVSTDVLDPPMTTKYGTWHLALPMIPVPTGKVPWNGVLTLRSRISPGYPTPSSVPLQAFVREDLTNLCVLEVR